MIRSRSVRRTAEELAIHPCTAFRWRHRVLEALVRRRPTPVLSGIIEVTEFFYPAHCRDPRNLGGSPWETRHSLYEPYPSDPHHCIVFARDRRGHTLIEVAGSGTPTVQALTRVLSRSVTPGSEICSLDRYWYKRFCQHVGLKHHAVTNSDLLDIMCRKTRESVDPANDILVYNVTRALTYRRRFQHWLAVFLGVALKYLSRYLAWFELLDRLDSSLA